MNMKVMAALAFCFLTGACTPGTQANSDAIAVAPDFSGINHWINTEPLNMAQLKGKVVLVEFWTYSCINCIRVMPYVKQWHDRYRDQGLVVVGVHTPEYGYEKIRGNLETAVKRFGIEYPVAQDNEYRTWNAFGNRYWPALYLIDKDGRMVYQHFGEGDYAQTEARIRQLLAEH
ncbi:thiol-disulfide isomerase/thioredoxin [Luteibacter sp. Sphag1AF]|uniref:thioredoxin family protein n=1 Tax=Luteibacter sp. Sphag1AF TaxID=2587031 RepID=UPI00161AEF6F|nr:thioredoxin family protein [Luteibacter sp. Sphag1AF]MBB3228151.1 thiol-disulfide isomerase/thioredoxin [Luteibacter sp. Sphag1AF]